MESRFLVLAYCPSGPILFPRLCCLHNKMENTRTSCSFYLARVTWWYFCETGRNSPLIPNLLFGPCSWDGSLGHLVGALLCESCLFPGNPRERLFFCLTLKDQSPAFQLIHTMGRMPPFLHLMCQN